MNKGINVFIENYNEGEIIRIFGYTLDELRNIICFYEKGILKLDTLQEIVKSLEEQFRLENKHMIEKSFKNFVSKINKEEL